MLKSSSVLVFLFVMYVLMYIVFILWSPKLLSSSVIPGHYRYDNMSMNINHSSNHGPRNAVLKELDCIFQSCLQKCCPSSQIFSYVKRQCFSPPEEQLSAITTKWTIDFPQFNILDNFSCKWQNTIILNKSRGEEYRLDENGILHESLRNLNHNLSTFCFEFISEDATFMPIIHLDGLFNDGEDEKWRFMFYAYGMSLSNLFLVITLGLYISTPALHRSVQNKSFSCYVISLIFGFSFLMAAQNIHKVNTFCRIIGKCPNSSTLFSN